METPDQCIYCDYKFKPTKNRSYNYAIHMGFKHNDWSYLDQWYAEKDVPEDHIIHARIPLQTVYARQWKCAVCDRPVIYDPHKHTLTCRCATIQDYDVPKEELPRYWRATKLLVI